MSKSENKPRQFWLFKDGQGCADPDYQSAKPDSSLIDNFIHVIEHSAYLALQKKVEELEEKIEKMKAEVDGGITCGDCVEAIAEGYTMCGDCSC